MEIQGTQLGLKKVAELRAEFGGRKSSQRKMPTYGGISTFGTWKSGLLVEIGPAYTELKDIDGGAVFIPNSHLCSLIDAE